MKIYGQKENNYTMAYTYDKSNQQEEFQVYAQDFNGKWHCGWVVIEQPWYSPSSQWTYHLFYNKYGPGICGGFSDLGLTSIVIREETIIPKTQVNTIKKDLESGCNVCLEYPYGNEIALIYPNADDSWIEDLYNIKAN